MSPERNTGYGLFRPWHAWQLEGKNKAVLWAAFMKSQTSKSKYRSFWRSPTRSPIDDLGTNLDRRDSKKDLIIVAPAPYITAQSYSSSSTPKTIINEPRQSTKPTMHSMSTSSWHTLPNEMKLAIIDTLDVDDVKSFSKVDQRTYQACVPALFKVFIIWKCSSTSSEWRCITLQNVKLDNFEVLRRFLMDVPRSYCSHIEELEVNTQSKNNTVNVPPRDRADALIALLSSSLRIHKLVLTVGGSLDKSVISPFPSLLNLKQLSITNAGDEKRTPLLVLLSLPRLYRWLTFPLKEREARCINSSINPKPWRVVLGPDYAVKSPCTGTGRSVSVHPPICKWWRYPEPFGLRIRALPSISSPNLNPT